MAPKASLSLAGGEGKQYVVVFNQPNGLPQNVERIIGAAGGSILTAVPQIGALAAVSDDPDFAAKIARDPQVRAVSANRTVQVLDPLPTLTVLPPDAAEGAGPAEPPGSDAQTGSEPFYPFQWDKKRMRASNNGSYSVQPGRPDVVVAILDTGAEILPVAHEDIAPNLDFARSRSFTNVVLGLNGDPNPASWDDRNGHGSWCLSAVAAPINGRGISGVAPRVKLVALKVINDDGTANLFSIALALTYAGVNKFDVASMSLRWYDAHPIDDLGLIIATQRAVEFARANGVTPIAALGNENWDISDGSFMGPFKTIPAELAGVIGVSATGYYNRKAWYSNYGMGKTDVSAPGGDNLTQNAPGSLLGMVVGAWTFEDVPGCVPGRCYVLAEGTSMATPNAAGVVALIISQYGDFTPDNSRKVHMSPTAVEAILQQTANNQPCPEPNTVTYTIPQTPPKPPVIQTATCKGEAGGYTNFFGKGIVDALKAVTEGRPSSSIADPAATTAAQ
jgi:subtilisin family serine protease